MRRKRIYCGSKWEPDWVRRHGGSQTNLGEVLDDCCYVTSASGTLCLWLLLQKLSACHAITIASFFGRELCWAWNCQSEIGTWWKTSQPDEGSWGRKPEDHWEHPSPIKKLMSVNELCCWWKTSKPSRKLRRKTRQGINWWKTSQPMSGMGRKTERS